MRHFFSLLVGWKPDLSLVFHSSSKYEGPREFLCTNFTLAFIWLTSFYCLSILISLYIFKSLSYYMNVDELLTLRKNMGKN